MSDLVAERTKPRSDFSTPAFHREMAAIQHRYSVLAGGGHMTQAKLIRVMRTVTGFVYWSEDPLTDGYVPLAIVYIRAGKGKVGIVFPKCNDLCEADGTTTDRSVTIHFIADVTVRDMITVSDGVLRALASLMPADTSVDAEAVEPCGFAARM